MKANKSKFKLKPSVYYKNTRPKLGSKKKSKNLKLRAV